MALLWCKVQYMRTGIIRKNEIWIATYDSLLDSVQQAYQKEKKPVDRIRTLRMWKSSLAGISSTSKPDSLLKTVMSDTETIKRINKHNELLNREVAIRSEIRQALLAVIVPDRYVMRGRKWWEEKINRINQFKTDSSEPVRNMGNRLESTITANCWMQYDVAMSGNNPVRAKQFVTIWLWSSPNSLGANYLMAKLLTEEGLKNKALQYLEKCRTLGMTNYMRLQTDTTFKKLSGLKKFDRLIREMDTLR